MPEKKEMCGHKGMRQMEKAWISLTQPSVHETTEQPLGYLEGRNDGAKLSLKSNYSADMNELMGL